MPSSSKRLRLAFACGHHVEFVEEATSIDEALLQVLDKDLLDNPTFATDLDTGLVVWTDTPDKPLGTLCYPVTTLNVWPRYLEAEDHRYSVAVVGSGDFEWYADICNDPALADYKSEWCCVEWVTGRPLSDYPWRKNWG